MKLDVRDLGFGYKDRAVGRDVSFELNSGEVVCLLGPNGGGKTTLFKTLLGLIPAQAGSATLDGEDISKWSRRAFARRIAYVPQAHSTLFPFTVHEIVLMGRTARIGLFDTPSRHDRDAADAAIASVGIERLRDRVYTEISGGERQLTLVARALAQEADIMVLDEPTASLDFGNQVRVLERIVALGREGKAVVLSTHDPDHAFLCGDRVALLHDGKLLALGPPDETVTAENLKTLYGVDVVVAYLPDHKRRVCSPSLGNAT